MFGHATSIISKYNITLMYSERMLKIVLKCRTYIFFLTQLAPVQVNQLELVKLNLPLTLYVLPVTVHVNSFLQTK